MVIEMTVFDKAWNIVKSVCEHCAGGGIMKIVIVNIILLKCIEEVNAFGVMQEINAKHQNRD
jgi:hypothetical protein